MISQFLGLVDGRQLRAALRSLAVSPDDYRHDGPPDPDLVALVEDPFEDVTDVADRLSALEATLRERGDRRSVFLTIYTRVTRAVAAGIEDGAFADPDWTADYLVTFAEYYRRAFLADERGDAPPDPWVFAFGTARAGDALVLQDAALGINAHVTYDLAFALRDVGIDPRPDRYADHRAVNDVLGRLVDVQQEALADLYAPGLAELDAAFGDLDEFLSFTALRVGREHAWNGAVALTDVRWSPANAAVRRLLRAVATGSAAALLEPSDLDFHRALRAVEEREDVVEALAAALDERLSDADLRALAADAAES